MEERGQTQAHAATRWARLVAAAATSPDDLRTLDAWSRHAGVSRSALKVWCGRAGARARASLLLGRVLRAVACRRRGTSFELALDIRDRRTRRKLFAAAGHPAATDDWHSLIGRQRLVDDARLLAALMQMLGDADRFVRSPQPFRPARAGQHPRIGAGLGSNPSLR